MEKTKQQLEQLLTETEAFLKSELFQVFQKTLDRDLKDTEESILHVLPISFDDMISKATLYGKRQEILSQLQLFEEFRAGLKKDLAELV